MDLFSKAQAAVEYIRERAQVTPRVGIILGSGLGGFASQVEDADTIPYAGIPHFPQSTVAGHSGKLVLGTIGGVPVAVMQGRVHAILADQLAMRAQFDNASLLQHHDLMRVDYRRQPVCNDQCGLAARGALELGLNGALVG